MSIRNEEELPDLTGRTVASAVSGLDDNGYGFVELRFTDGFILHVEEVGQAGQIEWSTPSNPSERRSSNPWDDLCPLCGGSDPDCKN